jgi:hypothetical protein
MATCHATTELGFMTETEIGGQLAFMEYLEND